MEGTPKRLCGLSDCASQISDDKRGDAIYCSERCRAKAAKRRQREISSSQATRLVNNQDNQPADTRNCERIGCDNRIPVGRVGKGAKYCSLECSTIVKNATVNRYHWRRARIAKEARRLEFANRENTRILEMLQEVTTGAHEAQRNPLLEANSLRTRLDIIENNCALVEQDAAILAEALLTLAAATKSILPADVKQIALTRQAWFENAAAA